MKKYKRIAHHLHRDEIEIYYHQRSIPVGVIPLNRCFLREHVASSRQAGAAPARQIMHVP